MMQCYGNTFFAFLSIVVMTKILEKFSIILHIDKKISSSLNKNFQRGCDFYAYFLKILYAAKPNAPTTAARFAKVRTASTLVGIVL